MSSIKEAVKTTALVLAVIYVANQIPVTQSLVRIALSGNNNA